MLKYKPKGLGCMKVFLIWIVFVSLLAVLLTVIDKRNARLHRRRVRERSLFVTALFGGSAAMYITMRILRHKTLHKRFMLGLPLIFLLQCAALYFLIKNGICL